jgi:CRP/FNR family transcriptional regulator, global nitrogen regulator
MLCVRDATTFDRQYARGEVIFREYDQGDGLYFLTDGVAKLSKAYSVGKEATLMLLGPWDVFGDLAFGQTTYQHAYQHARAEALTTCWVRKVPKVFVERAVKARPEVALKIATHLMRSQQTQYGEMVGYLLPYKVETKLANLLLMLARRFGGEEELGRLTIWLRLTHEELAAMVLSTRESVSHALSILRRRGTLTTAGGRIVILDPTSLLEAANAGTGF